MADIVYRTTKFPVGYVGLPYEGSIAVTGNATAITAASVSSGSLPPGLAISADFVRITGTPTATGTYTFQLTLTDTAGAATSGTYTIIVLNADGNDQLARDLTTALKVEWPSEF